LVICAAPDNLSKSPPITNKNELLAHDFITPWRKELRAQWLLKGQNGVLEQQEVRVRHGVADGKLMLRANKNPPSSGFVAYGV
jgi:hypothetical protein